MCIKCSGIGSSPQTSTPSIQCPYIPNNHQEIGRRSAPPSARPRCGNVDFSKQWHRIDVLFALVRMQPTITHSPGSQRSGSRRSWQVSWRTFHSDDRTRYISGYFEKMGVQCFHLSWKHFIFSRRLFLCLGAYKSARDLGN